VTAGLCVALAALARSQTPARLLVACAAPATQPLLELARALGVEGRIELAEAPAGSAAWIALLAGARAVVATEHDCEDLTREAFQARKAVIALADCGCVPGLVRDGVSGRVATTLDELAAAFDELSQDAALAERLGTGALDTLSALEVSWETVVSELTR
jgi:glycosyltransferase involved in cell wall biosynthesis